MELDFFDVIKAAPPVVSFVSGMLVLGLLLRYFGSFIKNDTRSANIDRANDDLLTNLRSEVDRLTERCNHTDTERDRYFQETLSLKGEVSQLSERVRVFGEAADRQLQEIERLTLVLDMREREIELLRKQLIDKAYTRPQIMTGKQ